MPNFKVTEIEGALPDHVQKFTAAQWREAEELGSAVLDSQASKSLDEADAPARAVSCAWLCSANNTFCNPDAPNPCIGAGSCRRVCW